MILTCKDVIYQDKPHLDKVLAKLKRLPPLVSPVEVRPPFALTDAHIRLIV